MPLPNLIDIIFRLKVYMQRHATDNFFSLNDNFFSLNDALTSMNMIHKVMNYFVSCLYAHSKHKFGLFKV